ncbi:hypothetical protein HK101_001944 [Irineochytrium annulatum]|nr:hypothetical protein HK101_001944 [Irineochytrium annulatum]
MYLVPVRRDERLPEMITVQTGCRIPVTARERDALFGVIVLDKAFFKSSAASSLRPVESRSRPAAPPAQRAEDPRRRTGIPDQRQPTLSNPLASLYPSTTLSGLPISTHAPITSVTQPLIPQLTNLYGATQTTATPSPPVSATAASLLASLAALRNTTPAAAAPAPAPVAANPIMDLLAQLQRQQAHQAQMQALQHQQQQRSATAGGTAGTLQEQLERMRGLLGRAAGNNATSGLYGSR